MRPWKHDAEGSGDLFPGRLDKIINMRHELVRLAQEIDLDWIEQSEGAKFWLRVMNELKARGIKDCLIAVVDGLKGFPEAIRAAFPETQIRACIVHLMCYGALLAKGRKCNLCSQNEL